MSVQQLFWTGLEGDAMALEIRVLGAVIPAAIDEAMLRTTAFLAAAPQKFQRFGMCTFHLADARAKREKVAAMAHVTGMLHV